ncbi:hypothetical protein [Cupriavidus necator]|uniref:hypothetical protein n=1 Tax=Cupriavidus necator TaxID=106590 RepID=UPI0005B3F280|nr:hypothetical protein [Cupriavidus necator]
MNIATPVAEADAPAWRFDHVNVSAGDRHALRLLFEGVMDLRPGYRLPFPFPGLWLYAGEQAAVHAVDDPALSAQDGAVRFGHIAFRSDTPAAEVIARLRASGLPFRIARVPADDTTQFFVGLPGGFVVELDVPLDAHAAASHHYDSTQAAPSGDDF